MSPFKEFPKPSVLNENKISKAQTGRTRPLDIHVMIPLLWLLWLLWDYPDLPLGTVEFEVWSTPALTQPFTLLSVEQFDGMPIEQSQAGFYKVRARYPWNTNLVSDWNK